MNEVLAFIMVVSWDKYAEMLHKYIEEARQVVLTQTEQQVGVLFLDSRP